jgi:hypothetical protein
MNDILSLKGVFKGAQNIANGGGNNLPSGKHIKTVKLMKLKNELEYLITYWMSENLLDGALVSVIYNRVTAKSNRISALLSMPGVKINDTVVGAKYVGDKQRKHLITHYVQLQAITRSIDYLERCIQILEKEFNGIITSYEIDILTKFGAKKHKVTPRIIDFSKYGMSRTTFTNVIVDSYYVETFKLIENVEEISGQSIITLFRTNIETKQLLESIGINVTSRRMIDEYTVLLDSEDLLKLQRKAPYLISMAVEDLNHYRYDDFGFIKTEKIATVPEPSNEPTIGVIDTLFDKSVYFSKWVTYVEKIDSEIPINKNLDYRHGTAISSLIVDGPSINPKMEDGCGRFKVRHFGVATGGRFSSFTILQSIKEIIAENKDIKVWNLSLGSDNEVNSNFISVSAALLDKIQYENDVIFVISGTNKKPGDEDEKIIGAPADSINSLVVNSVDFNNNPADYSRKGIVLSFFAKPDISYYGGVKGQPIKVCTPLGEGFGVGTSFAAPWIARKLSYLIDILGLSREVAKALIIDSSTDFRKAISLEDISYVGHGVVPVHINDIIRSKDDEIRFYITGSSEEYYTYNYDLPIPVSKGVHPFIARITMCYFPECSRNQGVDYTNTELNITFGRIKNDGSIRSFNNNFQDIGEGHYLNEENARANFRKWDNSKHIREILKHGTRPRKAYEKGLWGISITNKSRLSTQRRGATNFGLVVTLKELEGKNRIDEFIRQCSFRGWIVNKVNVENIVDIYNKAETEIEFE